MALQSGRSSHTSRSKYEDDSCFSEKMYETFNINNIYNILINNIYTYDTYILLKSI